MTRVLQITNSLRRNGTETFIMNVFRNIDRSKVMFDFLLLDRVSDGYEEEARALGAEIFYYPSRRKEPFQYKKALDDFFRKNASKYNAVHLNASSFTEIYPIKVAQKYGIPIRIVHSHSTSTSGFHNQILHKIHRKGLHKTATHFFACSEGAKEWGYGSSRVYDSSIVIPNGIDLAKYQFSSEKRQKIREEMRISPSTFVVCNTGGFRTVKNHPFLIEIFAEIKKQKPDSLLLLCGGGDTRKEIEQLIREKGLEKDVKIAGIRSDIDRILSGCDTYVFPSFYEGLPFALIEAQAAGLPVYPSDTISGEIGLTDKIKFMSLEKSAKEWAEEILKTADDSHESKMTEALSRYDIGKTCLTLEKIYSGDSKEEP